MTTLVSQISSFMADGESHNEEWLDFSSCLDDQQSLSVQLSEQESTRNLKESSEHDSSVAESPGNVHEVLKLSLCKNLSQLTFSCQDELQTLLERSCNHWLWGELVSKLNSVRQPKWDGSCIERCYQKCLQISVDENGAEPPDICLVEYDTNIFNFHGLNTLKNKLGNGSLSPASSERELVNKNDLESRGKLNSTADKQTSLSLSDGSFDDSALELEWSDNDVKDATLSSESPTSPGFDQTEAFADLARMSYEEILSLRDELCEYTKQYSDVLVTELENRDASIREKELKNDFISSFLAVQAKIREATKLAASKKKFSLQSNSSSQNQSLTTTIPYEIQNGGPSSDILEKLIEIMEAMKTDSSNVPTLLTNYILKVLCK